LNIINARLIHTVF